MRNDQRMQIECNNRMHEPRADEAEAAVSKLNCAREFVTLLGRLLSVTVGWPLKECLVGRARQSMRDSCMVGGGGVSSCHVPWLSSRTF